MASVATSTRLIQSAPTDDGCSQTCFVRQSAGFPIHSVNVGRNLDESVAQRINLTVIHSNRSAVSLNVLLVVSGYRYGNAPTLTTNPATFCHFLK